MKYGVLGPLQVIDDEGRFVELGSPKQRVVLAVLLAAGGGEKSVDTLEEAVWGTSAPDSALGTLQTYVSRLRKALEPGRGPGDAFNVIVSGSAGYRLVIDDADLDARSFERLAEFGRLCLRQGRVDEARRTLLEAEALWRGPAFAEHAHLDAVRGLAIRLEERRGAALEDRFDADLALGRADEVAAELFEAVRAEPLRERRRAQLALALYRSGRQAEALRAIDDARRTLLEELGIDPGSELLDLERSILVQDPALTVVAPSSVSSMPPAVKPPIGRRSAGRELFGRNAPLAQLDAELGEAAAGRRRIVLLGGEAGVGKTRLVEAFADMADERTIAVAWGHNHEGAGAPALWPWIQAMTTAAARDIVPEALVDLLGEGGAASATARSLDAARFELAESVNAYLGEIEQPFLVVLEDLHWADPGSLALLRSLVDRRTDSSILVVGTYRDDEVATASPEFGELLAGVARSPSALRLRLDGLGLHDVAALVGSITGSAVEREVAAALHARTGGNPFFLGELVRLLASDRDRAGTARFDVDQAGIPDGVLSTVRRRLDRLPGDLRDMLSTASVIGDDLTPELLAIATGLGLDVVLDLLDEALVASVVEEVPGRIGRFRFSHALVRETLVVELTAVRRARAHLRIGEAMEQLWADDTGPHVAALAAQFGGALAVGGAAKAYRYASLAAEAAGGRLAHDEAAGHWAAALQAHDLAPTGGREERWRVALALGESRRLSGDWMQARAAFDEALELAESLGLEQLAESATAYGGFWLWPQRGHGTVYPRVVAALERVLRTLSPVDGRLRCRALGCLAIEVFYVDRDRSLQSGSDAVAMARRLGDPELLAFALHCHLLVLKSPDQTETALAVADELSNLRGDGIPPELGLLARLTANLARLQLGRVEGFAAEAAACLEAAEPLHQAMLRALALQQRSLVAFATGDLTAAESLADEAYATYGPSAFWTTSALHLLQVLLIRREQGRLLELVGPAGAIDPAASPALSKGLIDTTNAYAAAELGRNAEALALLTPLPEIGFGSSFLVMKAMQAETVLRTGAAGAERLLAELRPYAGQIVIGSTGPSCLGAVDTVLGGLASALGELDGAVSWLESALRLNRRLGPGPHAARTALALARVLRSRGKPGDTTRSEEVLAEARALSETLRLPALANVLASQSP